MSGTNTQRAEVRPLQESRAALDAALSGLTERQLVGRSLGTDGWSPKDVLYHVARWDEVAVRDIRRASLGHVPFLAAFKPDDVDEWNAYLLRAASLFPLSQVIPESQDARAELLTLLNDLPVEMFGEGQAARIIVEQFAEHELGHARELLDWKEEALAAAND